MKVKIFCYSDPDIMQEEINKWLEDHEEWKYEIVNILQSECEDCTTISIWYKLKD